jgi:sugar phosphate isomerase/epimerase
MNHFKNLLMFVFLMLLGASLSAQNNNAMITRKGGPYIKISLNAYSFSKALTDQGDGKGAAMTIDELIDYAAEHNFDAVDLTAYFFPGYPNVPADDYINHIKRHAFEVGLDISGTGVRNNFADPDPAKRAADVKLVKEWIDVAVKLGAPVIRVFAGPIPPGYENKWDGIAKYMAPCLKECAEYGKLRGVLVGVQNHGDFLKTAAETIKLVKMVNSDWLGVIVDTGYFITSDPYIDIEEVLPYAVNFQLKESAFGPNSPVKTDLGRIMQILKRTGYRGYIPIETLSPMGGNKSPNTQTADAANKPVYDPFTAVPAFLKEVKAAQKAAFH